MIGLKILQELSSVYTGNLLYAAGAKAFPIIAYITVMKTKTNSPYFFMLWFLPCHIQLGSHSSVDHMSWYKTLAILHIPDIFAMFLADVSSVEPCAEKQNYVLYAYIDKYMTLSMASNVIRGKPHLSPSLSFCLIHIMG